VVTDNKNRTVSEIRHLLSRNNAKLAEVGSVAWMFENKGVITLAKADLKEEEVMDVVLEAGADDLKTEDTYFEITTPPDVFYNVKKSLEDKKFNIESANMQKVPKDTVKLEGKDAEQCLKLMEALEEHDDIQNVSSNFDIDESVIASLSN
jgi:YebC/PmpR family DNA-binding regulatory protein